MKKMRELNITYRMTPYSIKSIAICRWCGAKYRSWDALKKIPKCPYCNKLDIISSRRA